MSRDELLKQIREHQLILREHGRGVVIWSPNTFVPSSVRKAIQEHKAALRWMLELADVHVCPNPSLHRKEWSYIDGYYRCELCRTFKQVGVC